MPVPALKPDMIIAGASVRSLAESALRSGLKPMCVDLFADSDLTRLVSEAGLPPENVRRISAFDDVEPAISDVCQSVPLVPVGGLEVFGDVLQRLASRRQVFAMTTEAIQFLSNPEALFSVLLDAGHHVPNFVCRHTAVSHLAGASGTWLKKDAGSSGGHHVERVNANRLCEVLAALSPSEFLQQETEGSPCSATFLVDSDRHLSLLGCAGQLCGEPALNASGFQFCGNVGPVQLSQSVTQQLLNIASTLGHHVRLQGVFGIDFLLQHDRVIPIEVNPRLTASHELHEGRQALVLQHCDAFKPDTFKPDTFKPDGFPHGTGRSVSEQTLEQHDSDLRARLILYSDRTFTFCSEAYSALVQLRRSLHSPVPPFWISDLPAVGSIIEPETPFCSLNFKANGSEFWPSPLTQLQRLAMHVPIVKSADIAELLRGAVRRY